jgi:hypothetical protein
MLFVMRNSPNSPQIARAKPAAKTRPESGRSAGGIGTRLLSVPAAVMTAANRLDATVSHRLLD